MQEGHQFLDEKRISLAQEILRQLAAYEALQAIYDIAHREATIQLAAAAARHGVEGIGVHPPQQVIPGGPLYSRRRYLGQELLDFEDMPTDQLVQPAPPAFPSPEAELCVPCFNRLAALAAEQALVAANLHRLVAEYRRTERRARALENVLLPEIDSSIRFMDEQLEAIDQEEALRVRFVGSRY